MQAVVSILNRYPVLRKLLCRARIGLGLRSAGAYSALGAIQFREQKYLDAARSFIRAIRENPDISLDPYRGLIDSVGCCPAILKTSWTDATPPVSDVATHPDWAKLATGGAANSAEFRACLDRLLERDPGNFHYYQIATTLWSVGDVGGFFEYHRRRLDAQRTLAQKRGLDQKKIRYLRDAWTYNIGHIVFLDWHAKAERLGWRPDAKTIVLASPKLVSNQPYLECFRPFFEDIITDPARVEALASEAECLEEHVSVTTLRGEQVNFFQALVPVQRQWELENRPPLLTPSADLLERGRARLRQLGVPADAWYVGLHVRESGYHKDLTNQNCRDAKIGAYEKAIRTITERGGWVIRLGNPTMTRLAPMPRVVDYAHSELRCDWMDVFLSATMRFMIGSPSGITHVPYTFGVPTIGTEWSFLPLFPWHGKDIAIPKLFWSETKGRYLSFKELLVSGFACMFVDDFFERMKVRLVDNTPEDLNDVVVEMLDRLEGKPYSAADDALQARWSEIARPHGIECLSRLGGAFLRKHAFLLD